MGPPSYMWSVVDRNIVKRRMTVFVLKVQEISNHYSFIPLSISCVRHRKGSPLASQVLFFRLLIFSWTIMYSVLPIWKCRTLFNVLLTVHHATILGKCPTWRTNSFQCIYLFIYSSRHVSSMSCSSLGETDCINTIQYSQPVHDTATNTEWQLPEAVLIQFASPNDEHDMLETCREL